MKQYEVIDSTGEVYCTCKVKERGELIVYALAGIMKVPVHLEQIEEKKGK